jgi:hypothetical protein
MSSVFVLFQEVMGETDTKARRRLRLVHRHRYPLPPMAIPERPQCARSALRTLTTYCGVSATGSCNVICHIKSQKVLRIQLKGREGHWRKFIKPLLVDSS